jgi:hypothetical protein
VADSEGNGSNGGGGFGPMRSGRRLADRILAAVHQACDDAEFEVAEQLLRVLEIMLNARASTADAARRRSIDALVAAHERLWHLRNPDHERA